MDVAMQHNYPPEKIARINSCRRYLQVLTLADITNPHGNKILEVAKTGIPHQFQPLVRGQQFNQQRPTKPAWSTWKQFLKSFENISGLLSRPLQKWTQPHSKCRWTQPYIIHLPSQTLYNYSSQHQFRKMKPLHPLLNDSYLYDYSTRVIPEEDCIPVRAFVLSQFVTIIRNIATVHPPLHQTFPTFCSYVESLDPWEQLLLQHHSLLANPFEIVQALNIGQAHIATDGSVIDQKASFGYVIASSSHQRLVTGRGPVLGAHPSSFRAELYGSLAAGTMLHHLSIFTANPITAKYKHYMDNKAAITQITKEEGRSHHYPNHTLSPDWDILTTIATTTLHLPPPSLRVDQKPPRSRLRAHRPIIPRPTKLRS